MRKHEGNQFEPQKQSPEKKKKETDYHFCETRLSRMFTRLLKDQSKDDPLMIP